MSGVSVKPNKFVLPPELKYASLAEPVGIPGAAKLPCTEPPTINLELNPDAPPSLYHSISTFSPVMVAPAGISKPKFVALRAWPIAKLSIGPSVA